MTRRTLLSMRSSARVGQVWHRSAAAPEGLKLGSARSPVSRRPKIRCFSSTIAELLGFARDAFRWSEEQKTAGLQRVMECLHDPVLQLGVEVDQDVAAGDQIEPWRMEGP